MALARIVLNPVAYRPSNANVLLKSQNDFDAQYRQEVLARDLALATHIISARLSELGKESPDSLDEYDIVGAAWDSAGEDLVFPVEAPLPTWSQISKTAVLLKAMLY